MDRASGLTRPRRWGLPGFVITLMAGCEELVCPAAPSFV